MTMYRVTQKIALGERVIPIGTVSGLPRLKPEAISALLRRGAISEVSPPPLSVLPKWRARANRLARMGIIDAVQLIEGDAHEIAKELHVSRASVIGWQVEMERWLVTDVPPRKGG